eukprot:scaffold5756_cov123-Isochrysis_galbana.AAC.1
MSARCARRRHWLSRAAVLCPGGARGAARGMLSIPNQRQCAHCGSGCPPPPKAALRPEITYPEVRWTVVSWDGGAALRASGARPPKAPPTRRGGAGTVWPAHRRPEVDLCLVVGRSPIEPQQHARRAGGAPHVQGLRLSVGAEELEEVGLQPLRHQPARLGPASHRPRLRRRVGLDARQVVVARGLLERRFERRRGLAHRPPVRLVAEGGALVLRELRIGVLSLPSQQDGGES